MHALQIMFYVPLANIVQTFVVLKVVIFKVMRVKMGQFAC